MEMLAALVGVFVGGAIAHFSSSRSLRVQMEHDRNQLERTIENDQRERLRERRSEAYRDALHTLRATVVQAPSEQSTEQLLMDRTQLGLWGDREVVELYNRIRESMTPISPAEYAEARAQLASGLPEGEDWLKESTVLHWIWTDRYGGEFQRLEAAMGEDLRAL